VGLRDPHASLEMTREFLTFAHHLLMLWPVFVPGIATLLLIGAFDRN
jgi:hypothetical protein